MRINTAPLKPVLPDIGGPQDKNEPEDRDKDFRDRIEQILSMFYMPSAGGLPESGTYPNGTDPAATGVAGEETVAPPGGTIPRLVASMTDRQAFGPGGGDFPAIYPGPDPDNPAGGEVESAAGKGEAGKPAEIPAADGIGVYGKAGGPDGEKAVFSLSAAETEERLAGYGGDKESMRLFAVPEGNAGGAIPSEIASQRVSPDAGFSSGDGQEAASVSGRNGDSSREKVFNPRAGSTLRQGHGKEAGASPSGAEAGREVPGETASADQAREDSLFSGISGSRMIRRNEGRQAGILSHDGGDPASDTGKPGTAEQNASVFRPVTPTPERGNDSSSPGPVTVRNLEEVTAQMAEQIRTVGEGDRSGLKVQLRPKELGEIEILISMKDGRLAGRILVENSIAREALESQLPGLRDRLKEQNVMLHDVNISLRQDDTGQDRGGNNRFSRENGQTRRNSGSRKEEPASRPLAISSSGPVYRGWRSGYSLDRLV